MTLLSISTRGGVTSNTAAPLVGSHEEVITCLNQASLVTVQTISRGRLEVRFSEHLSIVHLISK